MAENVKESCLVLPRCTSLHLYYKETLRDKWGVFSHVIVNAEFDSGLKIKILSIFDPQNPYLDKKRPKSGHFSTYSMNMHIEIAWGCNPT